MVSIEDIAIAIEIVALAATNLTVHFKNLKFIATRPLVACLLIDIRRLAQMAGPGSIPLIDSIDMHLARKLLFSVRGISKNDTHGFSPMPIAVGGSLATAHLPSKEIHRIQSMTSLDVSEASHWVRSFISLQAFL
jgi:hypothetical protein